MSLEKARTQLQELKETLGSVLDRVRELEVEFQEPEMEAERTNGSSRSALKRINQLVAGLAGRATQEEILEGLLEDSQHFSERAILFRRGTDSDFYPWKSIGFEPSALESLTFDSAEDPVSESFHSRSLQVLTEAPERLLPWLTGSPPLPRQAACIPLVFDEFVPVVLYVDTSEMLDIDAIELSSHVTALVVKNHFLLMELERVGGADFRIDEDGAEAQAASATAQEPTETPQEAVSEHFVDESFYDESPNWEKEHLVETETPATEFVRESESWQPYESKAQTEESVRESKPDAEPASVEEARPFETPVSAEVSESSAEPVAAEERPEWGESTSVEKEEARFSDEGIAREWAKPSFSETVEEAPPTDAPQSDSGIEPWGELAQSEPEIQAEALEEDVTWGDSKKASVEVEALAPPEQRVEVQEPLREEPVEEYEVRDVGASDAQAERQEEAAAAAEPAAPAIDLPATEPAHGDPAEEYEAREVGVEEAQAERPEAVTAGVEPAPPAAAVGATEPAGEAHSAEVEALHNEARRFARLLVSEIKLYNEDSVREGRSRSDLYRRLGRDIERSRNMYDKRVHPSVKGETDYFHGELVRVLAEGDESKFGEGYPGPQLESK